MKKKIRQLIKSLLYYQGARRAALLTHSLVEMVRDASAVQNYFLSAGEKEILQN